MAQQILPTNTFTTAKWIVSSASNVGTHTTIASALASSSSGDTIFILPGTYTENPTLKAGVNLTAYPTDGYSGTVTILGKCTLTTAGTVNISGIKLQTNSDFCLAVTGSAASFVNCINCQIDANNNTAISYTSSSASSGIALYNCLGNIDTTGITYWVATGGGSLTLQSGGYLNAGNSTTASSTSACPVYIFDGNINHVLSTSSTGTIQIYNTFQNALAINTTCITTAGTGASNFVANSFLQSGTASAISIGTGTTLGVSSCSVTSSNTNAITGAGTLTYDIVNFGSSKVINTTTQTNTMSGTWTPVLNFGGATVGITYAVQSGQYTRFGNVVYVQGRIVLTSKGSSTGVATVAGLPFTTGANTYGSFSVGESGVFTLTATYTNIGLNVQASTTSLNLYSSANSAGGAIVQVTNAMMANTSQFAWSGFYIIS